MRNKKMKYFLVMLATALLTSTLLMSPVTAQENDPYGDLSDGQVNAKLLIVQLMAQEQLTLSSPRVAGFFWQARASFSDPRTGTGVEGASASLIGSTLYVSHGFRGGDSVFLSSYDINTDTWTHGGSGLPDATIAQSEMAGGTALGRHYAIGGRSGPSAAIEEFDPGTGSWTTKTAMPGGARGGMGAASLGGKIYVIGGRSGGIYGDGTILGTNEAYDAATDSWTTLAPLPIPVSDAYATTAFGNNVYVFGGVDGSAVTNSNVQIYNTVSDSWSTGTPMPTARGAAMAGACADRIVVFGGFSPQSTSLTTTEIYDPATDSWTTGPSMPLPANEIAQGMTSSGNQILSVGTGIFGVSGPVVQTLFCPNETEVPTLGVPGIGILIVVLALLSGFVLLRRRVA